METIKAPICDECPRKPECTFMCEERLDQFVREEELASIEDSLSVMHNLTTDEEVLSVLQNFDLPGIGEISLVTQVEIEGASASSSSPKLINQDKYVGIERSKWTPRPIMPGAGWAETISGKFSPVKPKSAIEVISLERQEFSQKTIYPKGFPIPVVCGEFCDKVSRCNLRGSGCEDLCKNHHKLGKLVHPVDIKWSVRFNMKKDFEAKAKTKFVKSPISTLIPEIALAHERTEDKTFAAYSATAFLESFDEPQDGCELEYTMDTGMASPEKSQQGFVPSFLYRTVYRDRKILLGFETRKVQKTYVETERKWERDPGSGNWSYRETPVIRTTSYIDDVPVYKWVRIPTLRPIGCYLNRGKVVGSTTIVTRKDRKYGQDKREAERQIHRHERVLIAQDEIDARKQVVMATC
ncbi:MAG: hypothetical protein OIN86_09930 [Candidatus Methanoperedens sp.]|nr:hypothetical protein [Candidatus Methanoperedens sp.]CAG0982169.1 hypothetical protein METP1_01835 [Methanosarcinales archaeon]